MGPRLKRRDGRGKMTLPVYRPLNSGTPCHQCPLAEDSKPPDDGGEMSDDNWAAFAHYLECRAINWQTPDARDPLVRRTATIIRGVEEAAAKQGERELAAKLDALMMAFALRGK